jgi:hypothetical protein
MYNERSAVTKYEMEKIAWRIEVDRMGVIGFKKPKPQDDDD